MVKRKSSKEIEDKILYILDSSIFSLSIAQVTKELKKSYDLKVSPQIVKRYLFKLKKEGKIN